MFQVNIIISLIIRYFLSNYCIVHSKADNGQVLEDKQA